MLVWKGWECCFHPNSQGVPGSSVLFSLWLTGLGQQASGEAARMLAHCLAGCRQAHQERPRPQDRTPALGPWVSDRAWRPLWAIHVRLWVFPGLTVHKSLKMFPGTWSQEPGTLSQVSCVPGVCSGHYHPSDWLQALCPQPKSDPITTP